MAIALRYAARTDLGLGPKSRNEDSGYAGPHLLVLADGMGGHAAGDVASSLIVGQLAPLDGESIGAEQALPALEKSVREANSSLRRAMDDDPKLRGMGSTTIAMLRSGNKLAMAHIGDSRAYLLRDGALSQLTRDHSFVQQLVDEQRITAEEAEDHPQRSLVTRVMTGQDDDEPDLSMRELKAGDRYLLCSDGLSDFVRRDIIEEILTESPTPAAAADRLIEVALKASARDNVTVVVADVVDLQRSEAPSTSPQIVGAASLRDREGKRTRGLPVSPAEKAASLARSVRKGNGEDDDDGPLLADEPRSKRVVWVRRGILVAALLLIFAGGAYGAWAWTQNQYYVKPSDGYVAIWQGVGQNLGPLRLSHVYQVSEIPVSQLPTYVQDVVSAGTPLGSLADATTRVETLRTSAMDCRDQAAQGVPCGQNPVILPSPTTSGTATTSGGLPTDTATLPGAGTTLPVTPNVSITTRQTP
ncbi:MAG TPA: protein phosphatase 2C domain-containing protein [Lapillicoccus sp.]|nr:protein phosphatase 2C domain-containing protein [Lapillicoccus sp.]